MVKWMTFPVNIGIVYCKYKYSNYMYLYEEYKLR